MHEANRLSCAYALKCVLIMRHPGYAQVRQITFHRDSLLISRP